MMPLSEARSSSIRPDKRVTRMGAAKLNGTSGAGDRPTCVRLSCRSPIASAARRFEEQAMLCCHFNEFGDFTPLDI